MKSSTSRKTRTRPASTKRSFPYRSGGGICLRPQISLSLINPNGEIVSPKVIGLVDSGADTSTFPMSWATILGIDGASCLEYETDTAGGKAKQFLYEPGIHATFMGHKLHLGATFSHSCGAVLLGRTDFFHYCKELRFDQQGQQFHVELADDMEAARSEVGKFLDLQARLVRQAIEAQAELVAAEAS